MTPKSKIVSFIIFYILFIIDIIFINVIRYSLKESAYWIPHVHTVLLDSFMMWSCFVLINIQNYLERQYTLFIFLKNEYINYINYLENNYKNQSNNNEN
jgi:hypothetical protein